MATIARTIGWEAYQELMSLAASRSPYGPKRNIAAHKPRYWRDVAVEKSRRQAKLSREAERDYVEEESDVTD